MSKIHILNPLRIATMDDRRDEWENINPPSVGAVREPPVHRS